MGTIYKRGKVYWIKYYRGSKCFRESSKSVKEADAKRLLKKREGEISQGNLPGIYFDRVFFDELAEDFLRDYRLNNKTVKRAEQTITHLKAFFQGYRATDITTPLIEEYVEDRLKWSCRKCEKKFDAQEICPYCKKKDVKPGATNATINRELSAMKRMFNLGAKRTPPKVGRVPYIPMLKEGNVRKGFFEHGDLEALRNHLPDYLKGCVTFAYKTGWRKAEVSSLTWSQVDRGAGIVYLNPGEAKNDEPTTVYLDEELKGVIEDQWEGRKRKKSLSLYVFPAIDVKPKIQDIRKAWTTACKNAKIGKRLFHDFRRTAVRNMIRAGIPERVAMMISGHKTRSVFDRYNIVSDTDLKVAAQKQEEYLKIQMGTNSGTICNLENSSAPKSLKLQERL
jgi:integrase